MNRVLAHTGARYPIVQPPMGWIARTQLKCLQDIIGQTVAQFFAITQRLGRLAATHQFG